MAFRSFRIAALLLALFAAPMWALADSALVYPEAPKSDVVENYFGTKVPDPYRWMEDIDSAQTRAWIASEQALRGPYLAALPARNAYRARLSKLYDYERIGLPQHRGPTLVYSRNSGLQNQSAFYVRIGSAEPAVLLDPNTLSADGTVAIASLALSNAGKLVAYSTQTSGSDWLTWRVRDVASGHDLDDKLVWAKFSGASWAADDSGFYYSAFDPPADPAKLNILNTNQKVYFHKLGTPQAQDALIYARPDHPDWFLGCDETDDGAYVTCTLGRGSKNGLVVRRKAASRNDFMSLVEPDRAATTIVDNDGSTFYVQTNEAAERGKLVALSPIAGVAPHDVIPQGSDTLESVSAVGGRFIARYLHDARSAVRIFTRDGKASGDVALPGPGTVTGFAGKNADQVTYYSFASYTSPTTIYAYDVAHGTSSVYAAPKLAFDPSAYTSEAVTYKSKDGTNVPMLISYKKGLVKNGHNPTILYGYGGFDISLTPAFSPALITWMESGGIYAVPNLRGGAEFGEAWHEAGMLDRKQNVFDDFVAAAHYLIDNNYTSASKLAVKGESNGGLLCGATLTQHPELIGAALCGVGVMDMLRFQKFTVGAAWIPEYGSSDASEAQFKTLMAYSPLENIKPGTAYPATLISTADHDDRVFPAHSFKFAATLQKAQTGPAPILIFVESKAGHGAGKPLSKSLDEVAGQYAFLAKNLEFTPAAPGSGRDAAGIPLR